MNSIARLWRIKYRGTSDSIQPFGMQADKGAAWGPVSVAAFYDPYSGITGVGNIASAEVFGSLAVGAQVRGVGNIASAEAFGLITVTWSSLFKGAYKLHVELGITLLTRVFW